MIVRPILYVILGAVGGYLGRYLGDLYFKLDSVSRLLGDNQRYVSLSKFGFIAIGILLGLWAFRWISLFVGDFAERMRETPVHEKVAYATGAILGLIVSALIYTPFVNWVQEPVLRTLLGIGLVALLVALSTHASLSMRDEFRLIMRGSREEHREDGDLRNPKVLDTNIIIDGRIASVQRSGFIEGDLYVPGFVLDELQRISDSADAVKRARGRRGLDLLNAMQKEFGLVVGTHDELAPREPQEEVDHRLIRLASAMKASILTNDFNLNKVAELRGVKVLNVNELASSLKPVVLPGEDLVVYVQKEGREAGQGIGYLDDGTMVIIEGGRRFIGSTIEVAVTSVLQNVSGKMIFSEVSEAHQSKSAAVDRNVRAYGGGRSGKRTRSGDGDENLES